MSSSDDDDDAFDLPVMGNWDAATLPPPPGREHELDPAPSDQQLLETLRSSYDESLIWRRVYPPRHDKPSTSFFGGKPLLPAHITWPRTTDGKSSMIFLGQVDLSRLKLLADTSLPRVGTLYFFLDCGKTQSDRCGRVLFDPTPSALLPARSTPENVAAPYDGYPVGYEWVTEQHRQQFRFRREFPKYAVDPVACRFFSDHHPTHYWGATGGRYQRLWKREQSKEVLAAFGSPAGRWWANGSNSPETVAGMQPVTPELRRMVQRMTETPWHPDDEWPYTWLFIEIALWKLLQGVAEPYFRPSAIDRLKRASEAEPQHSAFFTRHIERYQRVVTDGNQWLKIARIMPHNAVAPAQKVGFRNWIAEVTQTVPYVEPLYEEKMDSFRQANLDWNRQGRDPKKRPPYPKINSDLADAFGISRVRQACSISLMRGTELSLVESPEAASRIPKVVVDFFKWRHEPLWDKGSSFTRHQMFGPPRVMQHQGMQLAGSQLLLMQFDSDEVMHWKWGDLGLVHYWITREDLKDRNFKGVKVTVAA